MGRACRHVALRDRQPAVVGDAPPPPERTDRVHCARPIGARCHDGRSSGGWARARSRPDSPRLASRQTRRSRDAQTVDPGGRIVSRHPAGPGSDSKDEPTGPVRSNRPDRFDGQFDEVLKAAHRGKPWAFDRIFRALAPVVAAYLRAQGAAEPDDLTSEVFLGVLRNLHRFQGDEAQFRSWVFTIAHRRLLDERRRISRRPTLDPLTEAPEPLAPDDVEDRVAQALATERVRALCEQLVPDQRDVLILRVVARLSIDQIAAALDKTPGAVKALQRRGFRALSRILQRPGAML